MPLIIRIEFIPENDNEKGIIRSITGSTKPKPLIAQTLQHYLLQKLSRFAIPYRGHPAANDRSRTN